MTTDNALPPLIQPASVGFKELMLRTVLRGELPPDAFYVGLSSTDASRGQVLTLEALEEGEVNWPTYERQFVSPASWQFERDGRDIIVSAPVVEFRNIAEREPWDGIRSVFISTARSRGGVLLGWSPLPFAPFMVAPGSQLDVTPSVVY